MHRPHIALVLLLLALPLSAQVDDHRGELPLPGQWWAFLPPAADGFGYGYDSLEADLVRWTASPYVSVGTIGNSVQGRPIWQLSITSPANTMEPRTVIAIHSRTHPNEVQSTHVVNAIIDHLLSDDPVIRELLERTVFNIIPMYNPDGVELEFGRENANGVDLEREWDKADPEIEAAHLKARYRALMESPTPIRIMLNLHSAYLCERYFVYHVEESTSPKFAADQQRFITSVVRYFPYGIRPWDFYLSWTGEVPTHFPESWFWFNYGERVLAMTYEDMHCAEAGAYDTTAYAILLGIRDFLEPEPEPEPPDTTEPAEPRPLRSIAPNPFTSRVTVRFALDSTAHVRLRVFDALGAHVATIVDRQMGPGWREATWDAIDHPNGVYYFMLQTGSTTSTLPAVKIQ